MITAAYLDFCATTPVDPRVAAVVRRYMEDEFGNAGSRTHEYGLAASRAVESARAHVAAVCDAKPEEVIFTSGATEANNLALVGLAPHACDSGRRHMLALAIEHKAVLDPLDSIAKSNDIDVELIPVGQRGWVDPEEIEKRLRPDTVVVSTMHANNETGVIQPLEEIAAVLGDHVAYWHVDAAQTYGKLNGLGNRRIDLISMSGHKLYGPMGVGALVARRREYQRPPLSPLMFGGGQERGLRPGTVPVPLVVGMGEACRLAAIEQVSRAAACLTQRTQVTDALSQFSPQFNGDQNKTLPHVLNVSIPELDAEAAMMILRDLVAISNGSACTSSSYEPSHVLAAMGLGSERTQGALRISWSHEPMGIDWASVTQRLSDALR